VDDSAQGFAPQQHVGFSGVERERVKDEYVRTAVSWLGCSRPRPDSRAAGAGWVMKLGPLVGGMGPFSVGRSSLVSAGRNAAFVHHVPQVLGERLASAWEQWGVGDPKAVLLSPFCSIPTEPGICRGGGRLDLVEEREHLSFRHPCNSPCRELRLPDRPHIPTSRTTSNRSWAI
jgi:hypothetical protein